MCRPAATKPDPEINVKFAHKLAFLDELHAMEKLRPKSGEARDPGRRSQRRAA